MGKQYVRKTKDVYEVQGYFGSKIGWECIGKTDTYEDAKCLASDYKNKEHYTCRIMKRMVKI